MVLYLIGLGLGNVEDLTIHGLTIIKQSSKLYLLASKYYPFNKKALEDYLSRVLILIDPDDLEQKIPQLVSESCTSGRKNEAIALLMPGNPFCENYYPIIRYHCCRINVSLKVIHNISYLNAMGNTGIQLYKFGEAVFMDSCEKNRLEQHFQIINSNLQQSLNTLVIFRKEPFAKLGAELITAISKLDHSDGLNSSSKLVLLYEDDGEKYFDSGPTTVLQNVADTKVVLAASICADFDSVEEEYLRNVKRYHEQRKTRRESGSGQGNFHLIGLGLGQARDITVRGQRLIEESGNVFLESYTSVMLGGKEDLEKFFRKEIVVADREMVEQNSHEILDPLKKGKNVAFLVVGDPFGATTHADILLRALDKANDIRIANNASILNALGLTCLKPIRFGGTVSIPFWTDNSQPDSFYDKIAANRERGRHTLCLLDIQVKEQSFENLARGRKIYEKPRFMSTPVAAKQLLESKVKRLEEGRKAFLVDENTETISLNRVGTEEEAFPQALLGELPGTEQGLPLHSLVIVGEMDKDETTALNT